MNSGELAFVLWVVLSIILFSVSVSFSFSYADTRVGSLFCSVYFNSLRLFFLGFPALSRMQIVLEFT